MTHPWQPSAALNNLRHRAIIINQIRDFFREREVLEVETPLLCHNSVTDPFIESIPALFQLHLQHSAQKYYLQTSPEYAMKRLLAAGAGAIFQICKAFRQGEIGKRHNPEFTMLEWYRPGFDHHQLMDEMDNLLQLILKTQPAKRYSYQRLFHIFLNADPHTASISDLTHLAKHAGMDVQGPIPDKDTWLNLLFSHCIEPQLGFDAPCFLHDFPASQAALARVIPGTVPVAARFEVYVNGVELANGFYELQDAREQRQRFEKNLCMRKAAGLTELPIDELLLAALEYGLPDCAGVALGVDRLVMLATQSTSIDQVISFAFDRC